MSDQSSATLLPRRHDIDALRVMAFGLLIFYHIGMFYVANWDWHVKSQYQSQFLENIMLLVNHWRLPILFLISGLAIRFVLRKLSMIGFLGLRHMRLLLPLAFAVLVIIPPQLYYEMTQNGDLQMSYWQFYQAFFDLNHPIFENYQSGILPHMDVNHMWYIRELWTFTVYLLIMLPVLHSRAFQSLIDWLSDRRGPVLLLSAMLVPICLISMMVDSDSENYRKALGFTFLVYGYLLGWNPGVWRQIVDHRRTMLVLALLSYIVIVALYNLVWLQPDVELSPTGDWLVVLIRAINRCSWVLAILGFGAVYLNRPSTQLSYLNEAVYPYYILHQSIIVVAGYELSQLALGPVVEPLLLILITILGCVLLHEYVIRRVRILRPLFGLKWSTSSTMKTKTEAADNGKYSAVKTGRGVESRHELPEPP